MGCTRHLTHPNKGLEPFQCRLQPPVADPKSNSFRREGMPGRRPKDGPKQYGIRHRRWNA
eukprot:scaffold141008_cov72-Phaeocystis_antarctica.AAC.1